MRKSRSPKRSRRWDSAPDEDPAAGLLNLFDVWLVFSVSLLIAFVAYARMPELMNSRSDMTLVKNPGQADMEIITKKGTVIERFRATNQKLGGEGEKLGVAYRLKSGEVVYVPEDGGGAGAMPRPPK
ncbi:MAG: DUF2149 domain-containing protein [Planctomycetes bacterium]|nr:DUF2149 domain-containing protein [Planctomycetota bacterium]